MNRILTTYGLGLLSAAVTLGIIFVIAMALTGGWPEPGLIALGLAFVAFVEISAHRQRHRIR